MTLNVKSIEIYLDATATLTSEGLAEGALQVQDFRVIWTFDFDIYIRFNDDDISR